MSIQSGDPQGIGAMVADVRRRVNRQHLRWSLTAAAAAVGALGCLVAGIFALSGTGVPVGFYAIAGGLLALVSAGLWWGRRQPSDSVARLIDERCDLRDGVRTAYAFEVQGRQGGFESLQAGWTQARLGQVSPHGLVRAIDRRLLVAAVLLPLVAVLLGFVPESAAVAERRTQRAQTLALAEELNEGIAEEVEREIAAADEDEVEALQPQALREMVAALEISPEKADLLRQYAEMEQHLAAGEQALETPPLDRLLSEAAAQLLESPETKRLGQALSEERLADAAEELESFKVAEDATAESVARSKKELERLARLARRLAEAARRFEAARNNAAGNGQAGKPGESSARASKAGASRSNGASANATGTSGTPSDDAQDEAADDAAADDAETLADEIRELEEAVEEAERSLKECQGGQCSRSDLDKLSRCKSRANRSVKRLSRSLRDRSAQKRAQRKLRSLKKTLAQCQSAVAGQCQSPFAGKQPGQGTSDSDRDGSGREDGLQTDITAAVQGGGPSLTTIEEAESGDGVAGRGGRATPAEYSRQLEAFIERPDVPDEVKEGVKLYLENIHRMPDEPAAEGSESP